MRAFCDVGHCFQDTPFQTCKTEIFEVRPTHFPIFLTARAIIQKSSCQSLGSIYVISILEIPGLKDAHNFKNYTAKF